MLTCFSALFHRSQHPWLTGKTASDKPILANVLNSLKQFQASVHNAAHTVVARRIQFVVLRSLLLLCSPSLSPCSLSNSKQKFKVGVLAMMSDSLSDDEIEQLKQTFAQLDANGDGKITLTELKQAVAKGGSNLVSSAAEIEKLLKLADVDGDGVLSYEEVRPRSQQRREASAMQIVSAGAVRSLVAFPLSLCVLSSSC